MSATVLFQYPKGGSATDADVVVTPRRLRCQKNVFDVTALSSVEVRVSSIRWFRFFGIALLTSFGLIGLGSGGWPIGVLALGLAGFLLYRTLTAGRWADWDGIVVMEESEAVIMSGDSSNRVGVLPAVDRRIANEFANAVRRAATASADA